MKRLLLILSLVACGDPTGLTDATLVGSYQLTKVNAEPLSPGVSGSLVLEADSSFTMTGTGGVPNLSGTWTLTKPRGNIILEPAGCVGEITSGGLGFGECGPLLFFRKA
jgi:hypothetical protein